MPVNYYKRTLKATITNDEKKIYEMKEFWNKPEGWEYILSHSFRNLLKRIHYALFTGRLEDILIKCLEYLEALKWKKKKKNEKTLVIDFIFRNLFLFESGYCPCDNEKQIF